MIQLRPTFSESWYRINNLKVKLRSGAQISRQFYRGERWYVVRDPAGNQFHRLSDAAYRFIGLLDGSRTVEQAWEICGGQLADDAPTQPEIIQILTHLFSANLIEADITPDASVLLRRHKQLRQRKMQNRLMNALFPRIPLWDPDTFLQRWMPIMRHVFSAIGAVIWLLVVISAVAIVVPHWTELKNGAQHAMDPGNWLWLWGVFVFVKLIHELGHAFACRRFGGECHELGIMFLVFIPTPYVDASTAWGFPNRWQRIFVGAAGMIVELFFASLCAFAWLTIGDKTTLSAQLLYNAMLIASVSTVIFNANPLLRYDGYYILSDWLEIPNLRQKSSEYALGLIKRHIFKVKANQPLPPVGQRIWLFSYAITSSIYRSFVGFVIILIVVYKIPILGLLMAIGGVATWAIVPTSKLLKYLTLDPELHRKRLRASLFCGSVIVAGLVLIGMVNFWVYVDANGIVEPQQRRVIYSKVPGFVSEILARDGQFVRAGDKIMVCHNRELETQQLVLTAEMKSLRLQLVQANALDPAQKKIFAAQVAQIQKQLDHVSQQVADLTIRAPIDGTLVAPHLRDMAGAYLPRGTQELATVADMNSLTVRAVLQQDDGQLVHRNESWLLSPELDKKAVQVLMVGGLDPSRQALSARPTAIIGATQDQLPSNSLTYAGGGEIAPDPSDPKGEKPLARQFEVRVKVENPGGEYYPGQRAYVRFRLERHSLLWQWTRRLWQVLQSHENDSKLT